MYNERQKHFGAWLQKYNDDKIEKREWEERTMQAGEKGEKGNVDQRVYWKLEKSQGMLLCNL